MFNDIPDVVYDLAQLRTLWLRNTAYGECPSTNRISRISPKIVNLENLNDLSLEGNPIESPPPEVVTRGAEDVKNYFRQLQDEGEDHLYEAKLLIVGEGGAGKTTLSNKIRNPNYRLQKAEKSTEGIDVVQWTFRTPSGPDFRVNIWDFGGQEIYHATHQFFLTQRSLYLLVADTRKEDTDFYYWLNVVDTLSDHSPLIVVKNEKQDRHAKLTNAN